MFLAVALVLLATSNVGSMPVATEVPVGSSSSSASPKATTPKSSISDANLDAALSDSRYLTRQLKCALGEAPCDPVGKRLKSKCYC